MVCIVEKLNKVHKYKQTNVGRHSAKHVSVTDVMDHTLQKSVYFNDAICMYCHKKGHIVKACHQKAKTTYTTNMIQHNKHSCSNSDNLLVHSNTDDNEEYSLYHVNGCEQSSSTLTNVDVNMNGKQVNVHVDTGASVSLISELCYMKTWSKSEAPTLTISNAILRTYTR